MASRGTSGAGGGASSSSGAPRGYREATAAERRASRRATGSSTRYVATGELPGRASRPTRVNRVQSGAVSAAEFERATGVNPRTGRRRGR